MRLRRLAVHGFKTFAARAQIELEPGITAVVGPNGSGKSNLVDAIRWGLGETNARELRGARMDEVIFSGGRRRASMGMAEVELTVDNEEGRLPVEDAEVAIARRVTRGGDSEFRLNGARVRLRDLERLLSATGLTQNGYALVAQNDVDGIIEASPEQRRALVEEAAGVRGLRAARDDALRRVESVETGLLRLVDLLGDAEPRLAELAEQAELAMEQRSLAERLAELRGSLARETWRSARAEARRARQRLGTARSRAEAAAEAEAGFNDRLADARLDLEEVTAGCREALRRLEEARLAAERAAGEGRRFADRESAGSLHRAAAGAEVGDARRELAAGDAEVGELAGSVAAAGRRVDELSARLAALERQHAGATAAARAADERLAESESRFREAEDARDLAASALRDAEARVGLADEGRARLDGEVVATRSRVEALALEAREARVRAEACAAQLGRAAQAAGEARSRAAAARTAQTEADARLSAAQRASRECAARAAGLRGEVEGRLGAGGRIAAAVRAGDLRATRFIELVTVLDPHDQAAIEAALEPHLAAWLVDDLGAAARLLAADGAREEVLQRDIEAAPPVTAPSGVRAAVDAVRRPGGAAGALAHCLRRVWLAPDLAAARRAVGAAGGRAVLPDGTVVTAAGVRGGGRPGATLALAAEEREAGAAAATARGVETDAVRRSEDAVAARSEAERSAEERAATAAGARAEAADAAAAAASASTAFQAAKERVAALEAEVEARQDAIAEARARAAIAAGEVASRGEAVEAAGLTVEAARAAAEARRRELAGALGALRDQELAVARAEPEARESARRLAAATAARDAAAHRLRVADLRLLSAEEEVLSAAARRRAATRLGAAAVREVAAAEIAAAAASDPVVEAEALVRTLEDQRSEVAVARARAEDELAAAEADLATAEERVVELAEAVRGDVDDEGPEPDAQAAERAEREIARLERRVAGLGPVNALAPEQHAVLEERVIGLRSHHHDLADACGDIRQLSAHLTTEIDARFGEVFVAVDRGFRELFAELFGGGRAQLRLQQPAPPEEDDDSGVRPAGAPGGVEILAQPPPGKRLQALSLLSGGERALTALAMILALQQVAPSPFYVLDEVDAPLDDANIGRFTRVLRRLAATQQFVIVTHNHVTMTAADALYGVTMDPDGTSRLLSVRITEGGQVRDAGSRMVAVAS